MSQFFYIFAGRIATFYGNTITELKPNTVATALSLYSKNSATTITVTLRRYWFEQLIFYTSMCTAGFIFRNLIKVSNKVLVLLIAIVTDVLMPC